MKNISKLLAVLLAMSMVLCGCSDEAEDVAEIPAEEEAAVSEEEAPEAKTLSLGQVEDGVYTNEYLDVYFAPEGWTVQGAEELQDALAGVADALEGTDLEEQMEGMQQVMDLQAIGPDGTTNVNVIYTKMGAAERLANLAVDEETAMDAILGQLDTLKESYAAMGIEVLSMDKISLTYRGEERIGICTMGSVQGVEMCILQVYERTLGSYSVVITSTALTQEDAANTLSMFEALNP